MAEADPTLEPSTRDYDARMTFGEHLEELRKRILWALIGGVAGIGIAAYFINEIVAFIAHPYRVALRFAGYPDTFIYRAPAEVLILYMNLAIQVGLIIASPWIIYQLWLFIAAGLYPNERRAVYKYIGPSILLFLSGVAFFFFVVLPITLSFFVRFAQQTSVPPVTPWPNEQFILGAGQPPATAPATTFPAGDAHALDIPIVSSDPTTAPAGQARLYYHAGEQQLKMRVGDRIVPLAMEKSQSLFTPLPTMDDYLSFVTFLALLFGVSFELPMVIMVLAQVGIVSPATFRKGRKFAYFGAVIVAAIATPTPDILTMAALALPLVALYEFGILLGMIVQRKRAAEDEAAA